MALTTSAKRYVNRWLRHVNLRLETLTLDRMEDRRLHLLQQRGQFEEPQFEVPPPFESMDRARMYRSLDQHRDRWDLLTDASRNEVKFTFDQIWFTSPDAEILYSMIRMYRPRTILEVGCGNSTKISRLAIGEGQLDTQLICVDPDPRTDISPYVDRFFAQRVETVQAQELFSGLGANDILFIDSSHEVKTGSDVVFLFLNVLPKLRPGVLIHVHDIFLPFDYPREWVIDEKWGFTEQYIVQCLLMATQDYEVLWAGHYLQRTDPGFGRHFPHLNGRQAKSLWLRKTR